MKTANWIIKFRWVIIIGFILLTAYKDAVIKTLTTTGKGIIINAVSVIVGFAALLFSVFMPVQLFGFLIVISIFACLVGALIIIPALVLITKPKFLEPKN